MVSGRSLIYFSLPSVALLLGVFWFRGRNKNRIEKNEKKHPNKIESNSPKDNLGHNSVLPSSKSMDIGASASVDNEKSMTKVFGKSAPIQIVKNGSWSPVKREKYMDYKVQKTENQGPDKIMVPLDEHSEKFSSPVDLPGSFKNLVSFPPTKNVAQKDEPVVIEANKTTKISAENLFQENTYTKKECEEMNCTDLKQSSHQETNVKKQDSGISGESNTNEGRNIDSVSPSLSLSSVQSGDSGKGSSLPHLEGIRAKTMYEFFFPTSLIGHLYGRKRSFINQITTQTSAKISLRRNPFSGKVKICVIEGTEAEINAAYTMIRQRLPSKRYPNFTMQRIHVALPQTIVPLSSENILNLQLRLIEGINNDVVVSSVISGEQIFVQHPLHPSHPSLSMLQKCLYDSYTNSEAPLLPGIEIGAVCVLPVNGIWYRVQIVNKDEENDEKCLVMFLDFGGYVNVNFNELRQIRSDFMGVPFQATECVLSNIKPIESSWTAEATDILCKLTKGIVLQAQVAGYNSLNIPEIYLFACLGPNNVVFVNKELVARNLAKWVVIRN